MVVLWFDSNSVGNLKRTLFDASLGNKPNVLLVGKY